MILDKKGQGGLNTFLVFFAVALVVGLIIAIFYVDVFGLFGEITDIDVDIAVINQGCIAKLSAGSFCTDKIEISKNTYINCPYAIENFGASIGDGIAPKCNETEDSRAICNKLKSTDGKGYNPDEYVVNGRGCRFWNVLEYTEEEIKEMTGSN